MSDRHWAVYGTPLAARSRSCLALALGSTSCGRLDLGTQYWHDLQQHLGTFARRVQRLTRERKEHREH